jgi:RNA polymerase-binding transcription factor
MNVEVYKRVLLDLRTSFSARLSGDAANGRAQRLDVAGDAADAAVVDESGSEDFSEAERDWAILTQIDAALRRIDDGTYGRCAVDGAPIEQNRLDASQTAFAAFGRSRTTGPTWLAPGMGDCGSRLGSKASVSSIRDASRRIR